MGCRLLVQPGCQGIEIVHRATEAAPPGSRGEFYEAALADLDDGANQVASGDLVG